MISCKLMGGLGNQLFQTAVVLAEAKDKNKKAIFHPEPNQDCSRKINYNDSYFHKLERTSKSLNFPMFRENGFCYKPIQLQKDTMLFGYFQSEKYFKKHKDYILDTLTLPEKTKKELNNKYKNLVKREDTVSVHVRRGDYLRLQHFHCLQTMDYYKRAMAHFPSDSMFVIFSDDVNWCKEQDLFKNLKNKQFIQDVDYNELYLMSQCRNHIIANSSFSWWGAYMNRHNDKKVICPQNWFGPKGPKDIQDIRPPEWITISS